MLERLAQVVKLAFPAAFQVVELSLATRDDVVNVPRKVFCAPRMLSQRPSRTVRIDTATSNRTAGTSNRLRIFTRPAKLPDISTGTNVVRNNSA